MGRTSFENFGKRAELLDNFTSIAGRYLIQKEAERLILFDIIQKLKINPSDSILDIGCGTGNLLIPLSFFVKKIVGVDHQNLIKKLMERYPDLSNIQLISGNFIDLKINDTFNKILIYSVIHYLESEEEVFEFINKALSLVASGGKLLIGDIPNRSQKERFLSSAQGKEFIKKWENQLLSNKINEEIQLSKLNSFQQDDELVIINDELILKILKNFREKGYNTYIYSQPPELPFGYTREDILIERLL